MNTFMLKIYIQNLLLKKKLFRLLVSLIQINASAIADTYQNTSAKVINPDGETDEFSIKAGVLQGDIVVLDHYLRTAIDGREEDLGFTIKPRQSRRVGPLNITDLDFADDIALLSDTAEQAQKILNRDETAALHVGLHMNAKKTKFMAFNQQTVTKIQTQEPSLLEEVQDFKYLGAWVRSTEQDVKTITSNGMEGLQQPKQNLEVQPI